MSTQPRQAQRSAIARHLAAVAGTLGWAQESAERGDYADALKWIQTVEAIGEPIPPSDVTEREALGNALARNHAKWESP